MATKKDISLSDKIELGLKLMYQRLLEKAIRENDDLVIADENGNPIRVKATELKARLK